MAKTGVARKVREAALILGAGGATFSTQALAEQTDFILPKDRKKMLGAVRDLVRGGFLMRAASAVYKLGRISPSPQISHAMWRVLRARRRVTVADLQELAGATEGYAKEWLQTLARRGVVRRIAASDNQPHAWQLIVDSVEPPELDDNAAKLRKLRKKKALAALGQAEKALAQARDIISKEE